MRQCLELSVFSPVIDHHYTLVLYLNAKEYSKMVKPVPAYLDTLVHLGAQFGPSSQAVLQDFGLLEET